jgi:hypothetical protein
MVEQMIHLDDGFRYTRVQHIPHRGRELLLNETMVVVAL